MNASKTMKDMVTWFLDNKLPYSILKVFFNPPHIGLILILYLGCLSGHSLSIVLTGGGGGTELGLPNPEKKFI